VTLAVPATRAFLFDQDGIVFAPAWAETDVGEPARGR
jgi:hypothetical protein